MFNLKAEAGRESWILMTREPFVSWAKAQGVVFQVDGGKFVFDTMEQAETAAKLMTSYPDNIKDGKPFCSFTPTVIEEKK